MNSANSFRHSKAAFIVSHSSFLVSVAAFASLWLSGAPHAQSSPAPVPAMRLYVLDCGTMKERDGVPYGLSHEQMAPRDL